MIGLYDLTDKGRHSHFTGSYGDWNQYSGTNIFDAWDDARGDAEIIVGVVDDGAWAKSDQDTTDGHEDFSLLINDTTTHVFLGGRNYLGTSEKYYDNTTHGTRVSGIIGAVSNSPDSVGIAGIAGGSGIRDNIRMYALKSGTWNRTTREYSGALSEMAAGIMEAASSSANGLSCDIINISSQALPKITGVNRDTTGGYNQIINAAVAFAYANDVPVINSIGNQPWKLSRQGPNMASPGSCPDHQIIVVGGHRRGSKWKLSARGKEVLDIVAPVDNTTLGSDTGSAGYSTFIGTSSAAPHVAGIAALMLEKQQDSVASMNVPDYLAVEDYIQLMAEGAYSGPIKVTGEPLQKSDDFGYGIINAERTLDLIGSPYKLEHISIGHSAEAGSFTLFDSVVVTSSSQRYNNNNEYIGKVRQYEFVVTKSFGTSYPNILRAWVRGAPTKGFPSITKLWPDKYTEFYAPLFTDQGWAEVIEFNASNVKLRTYLHQIERTAGAWEWLNGTSPDSIRFELSILSGSQPTSVNFIEKDWEIQLEVRPNIISENDYATTVHVESKTNAQLLVYDMLGRCVYDCALRKGKSVTAPGRAAIRSCGMYYIVVNNDVGFEVRKLIVR